MHLVTGATGTVGREVVRALAGRGEPVRAAVRDPDSSEAMFGAAVEHVGLDMTDPGTYPAAVRGCRSMFLLRPPAVANTRSTLSVLVARAREAGVGTIVFLSVTGAARNPLLPHHWVERTLRGGPADWAILRAGFFAQNFETAYAADVRDHDRVCVPAGRGRVAFVDVRDIAEVAATVLRSPAGRLGNAYTLTGGEAVSFDEAARVLSATLGRTIRYDPASVPGYLRQLRGQGLPMAQALVQTVLHVGLRFGQAARVDPTLRTLLGREPRTVAEYVTDRAGVWARNG